MDLLNGGHDSRVRSTAADITAHPLADLIIRQVGSCRTHVVGDVSHVTEDVTAVTATMTRLTDDEIRERMSGNICRCGAYPGIVAAIQEVHSGKQTAQTWAFVDEQQLARARQEDANEAV